MNEAPATPLPPINTTNLAAFDQHFRQVADWTNNAFMGLLEYVNRNADFAKHFAVFPGIHLKPGAGSTGPTANVPFLDPSTIKTPEDLKGWLGYCIVATPNLPDPLLEPSVKALRERAIEWAITQTKAIDLANKNTDTIPWLERVRQLPRAQTLTGIPG